MVGAFSLMSYTVPDTSKQNTRKRLENPDPLRSFQSCLTVVTSSHMLDLKHVLHLRSGVELETSSHPLSIEASYVNPLTCTVTWSLSTHIDTPTHSFSLCLQL